MPESIQDIVYEFSQGMKKIYGKALKKVLLYGSYARGDFNSSSDIDIMVLVTLNENKIKEHLDELAEYVFEMDIKYNVSLSPIVKNEEHFYEWLDAYPFYMNIQKEGVVVSE